MSKQLTTPSNEKMEVESVLVTGSNKGIGLEFVRQFLGLPVPPKHIFAACRSPEDAHELAALQKRHSNLYIVKIDFGDLSTVKNAANTVEKVVGDSGLNLIINNAGIARRDGLPNVDPELMIELFKVNAVGPLVAVQTFLPLLRRAAAISSEMSINRAAVINISSGVGSITENNAGGAYAYRTSKCALNMITKNLSLDLKKDGILVTAVHPGWVKTDMGGANAVTDTSDCVKTLIGLLSTFTDDSCSGKFYHFTGREMAW